MGYIILHNRQSQASRDFVASLPAAGHTIIEWYTEPEAVAAYMAEVGIPPSDFPSVVLRLADREVAANNSPDNEVIPAHIEPARWELVRCPANLAEVDALVEGVE